MISCAALTPGTAACTSHVTPGVLDCYTFVFDEPNPRNDYYTMLATDETGAKFSQWTEGLYDPNGANDHLGVRVPFRYLGKVLVDHMLDRMKE